MRPGFFLAIAILLATALPAAAQRREPDGVQPLDRLLPEIRRTHPGEFYDADGPRPGPGGSQHYRLKWMTPDGRVVWYDTDARTGRVLGTAPGRADFGDRQRFRRGDDDSFRGRPQGYESRRGYDKPFDRSFSGRGEGHGFGGRGGRRFEGGGRNGHHRR